MTRDVLLRAEQGLRAEHRAALSGQASPGKFSAHLPDAVAYTAERLARIDKISRETDDIRSLTLVPADGQVWPSFEAGAHIDLVLPNGMVRQYSLINPGSRDEYQIAVLREAAGRGGSAYLFDNVALGDELRIRGPRNNFHLRDDARTACLIAGGIGITPLLAMAKTLSDLGRPWHLYYCVRDESAIGFKEILAGFGEHVTLHVDAWAGGPPSIAAIIEQRPESTYYCCGPAPMLDAFRQATASLPAERAILESFTVSAIDVNGAPFEIELARSGRVLTVPPDKSILEILEQAGLHVLHSCRNGQCGTCEVKVLAGTPDHRDSVLTAAEQAEGKTIMVCCSRAHTPRLLLDI